MGVLNPFKSRPFEIKSMGHAKKLLNIGSYRALLGLRKSPIRIETISQACEMWEYSRKGYDMMMFDGFIIEGGK